jgi:hypothetical protein
MNRYLIGTRNFFLQKPKKNIPNLRFIGDRSVFPPSFQTLTTPRPKSNVQHKIDPELLKMRIKLKTPIRDIGGPRIINGRVFW